MMRIAACGDDDSGPSTTTNRIIETWAEACMDGNVDWRGRPVRGQQHLCRHGLSLRDDLAQCRSTPAPVISLMVVLVVLGAVAIRIFDAEEYPTIGDALWFTLQTVTTVGYGDNTPDTTTGRTVTSIVMLSSIGLITIITAVVTSLFIQSARNRRTESEGDATAESLARIEASLALPQERLDRIEKRSGPQPPGVNDAT
jgi:voltage-gated potassium channel